MTKVPKALTEDEYNAGTYLSLSTFLGYYEFTDDEINNLQGASLNKPKEWVNNSNRTVETTLYPYNDQIPLDKSSESWTYAKSMALHWAQYEKAADEGSPNEKAKLKLFEMDKKALIATLRAQPQTTTQRVVVGSDFKENEIELYSQNYGNADLL